MGTTSPLQLLEQGKYEEPQGNCMPAALLNMRTRLKCIKFPNLPFTSNFSPLLSVAKLHQVSALRRVLPRTGWELLLGSEQIHSIPLYVLETTHNSWGSWGNTAGSFFYLCQWQGEMQPVLLNTVTPCHLHRGELLLAQLFSVYFDITHWSSSPINKLHTHQ